MTYNRRETFGLALAGGAVALVPPAPAVAEPPKPDACVPRFEDNWRRGFDGQRVADLGDGRFLNPLIAGDHPDPAILKDGADYYMTFSSFDSYPG
ncbi:MAG: xylan 1,4-beta-xylosidase, partial [Lysobacteraceae bacterium]